MKAARGSWAALARPGTTRRGQSLTIGGFAFMEPATSTRPLKDPRAAVLVR